MARKILPLKKQKKWIQGMGMKEGAFTKQAMAEHMGVQEFARHVMANKEKYNTTTVRRAMLAQRFKKGI